MLCQLLLHSKMNQPSINIYPLPFGFSSHLGHPRALSEVPCAIKQFPSIIYFIHSINSVTYVSIPISQFLPQQPFPPWHPYICSLCLCLYFCFANKVIYTIQSQGRGSLVGCHLWGHTESDMTEVTQQQQQHTIFLVKHICIMGTSFITLHL